VVVIGEEEGIAFAAETTYGDLPQHAVITVHTDRLIDIADVFVQALGDVEMGLVPSAFGQGLQSAADRGGATANGHERDAALVEAGEFGVVGELGIEVQPVGIATGDVV